MARKNSESNEVTQQHIEDAMRAEQGAGAGPGMVGAFNPAEFARKAAAIAKIAQPFIAIAASTNWKNPVAAAGALVKLYALLQDTREGFEPALPAPE